MRYNTIQGGSPVPGRWRHKFTTVPVLNDFWNSKKKKGRKNGQPLSVILRNDST